MIDAALAQLRALADPARADRDRAAHKADRSYLGVPTNALALLVAEWRAMPLPDRVTLADELWQSGIHDARVAAAKLLIQARIRPDQAVWETLLGWLPDFDTATLADLVTDALARRLAAGPTRIAMVKEWTDDPNPFVRRAALMVCRPFLRQPHPGAEALMIREQALAWAETALRDRNPHVRAAVRGLVGDLARHDPARAQAFAKA